MLRSIPKRIPVFAFKSKLILSSVALILVFSSSVNGQWVSSIGPYGGGRIWAVGSVGDVLFVSLDNTVCRSTNGGKSWSKADTGLLRSQITVFLTCGQTIFA